MKPWIFTWQHIISDIWKECILATFVHHGMVLMPEYSGTTRSIPRLLMSHGITSPGHVALRRQVTWPYVARSRGLTSPVPHLRGNCRINWFLLTSRIKWGVHKIDGHLHPITLESWAPTVSNIWSLFVILLTLKFSDKCIVAQNFFTVRTSQTMTSKHPLELKHSHWEILYFEFCFIVLPKW